MTDRPGEDPSGAGSAQRENDACYVCGRSRRKGGLSYDEEFYPGLWCHISCLNSPAGIAWREARRQEDRGYARYLRMSTVGLSVTCPSCGEHCLLSAKARGMGAGSWETCCTRCDKFTVLNGYLHPAEYDRLGAAERTFLLQGEEGDRRRAAGDDRVDCVDSWRAAVEALAAETDRILDVGTCACGGSFSVAARPRCPHCHEVVFDSYFHYVHPEKHAHPEREDRRTRGHA